MDPMREYRKNKIQLLPFSLLFRGGKVRIPRSALTVIAPNEIIREFSI
jgi:hypothetical protein